MGYTDQVVAYHRRNRQHEADNLRLPDWPSTHPQSQRISTMSHCCGASYRREQDLGTREDRSSRGSRTSIRLPSTISADGKTWTVTPYLRNISASRPDRSMVTAERIRQVLGNWLFRCITTSGHRDGHTYWGKVRYEENERLMKVVVSLDGENLVNAYLDDKATRDWRNNSRRLFDRRCKEGSFEVRK